MHPAKDGVTETVDVTAPAPVFVAVKAGVLALPLAERPIDVTEFVHANVAPAGVLVKLDAATELPLHAVTFEGAVIVGIGLIVTVTVELLEQPPVLAVTV